MDSLEDEGIFQINDYTTVTPFEELTNKIELFMRSSGFSADFRQIKTEKIDKKFSFHGYEFICFQKTNKRGGKRPDVERNEQENEGLKGPLLTQLFGLSEFLMIMGNVPKQEESTILSAASVAGFNAKCLLPVFLMTKPNTKKTELIAKGILTYPGFYTNFEVWSISKSAAFATDFDSLLTLFTTRISPNSENLTACIHTAHRLMSSPSSRYDIIREIVIFSVWSPRPAYLFPQVMTENRDVCDGMRLEMVLEAGRIPVSECLNQVLSRENEAEAHVNDAVFTLNTPQFEYFDEFLLMLNPIFPVFPINSLWTKAAIYLFSTSQFSVKNLHLFINSLRRRAEKDKIHIDFDTDFLLFDDSSDMHQFLLILTGAMQSTHLIHQNTPIDPQSRLIFLHFSPFFRLQLTLMDPESTENCIQNLLIRVLKSLFIDKFQSNGRILTINDVIEWHKTAKIHFSAYNFLTKHKTDTEIATLWEKIASESHQDIKIYILSELIKEMEISAQQLEGISKNELEKQIIGLEISAILAIIFNQQTAFLTEKMGNLEDLKDFIRPFFVEFVKNCGAIGKISLDSVIISELASFLTVLETRICVSFSLYAKNGVFGGIWSELIDKQEVEVRGKEAIQGVLEVIRGVEEWKRLVVLKGNSCRFGCLVEGRDVKLAVAKEYREVEGS